jgi:hypothetical protein
MVHKKYMIIKAKDHENTSKQHSTRAKLIALRAQKRKDNLAKALRENLRKRKAQMRQRSTQTSNAVENEEQV